MTWAPTKLPRLPARYTTSAGTCTGFLAVENIYLEVRAGLGGIKRNVDESRGAEVYLTPPLRSTVSRSCLCFWIGLARMRSTFGPFI